MRGFYFFSLFFLSLFGRERVLLRLLLLPPTTDHRRVTFTTVKYRTAVLLLPVVCTILPTTLTTHLTYSSHSTVQYTLLLLPFPSILSIYHTTNPTTVPVLHIHTHIPACSRYVVPRLPLPRQAASAPPSATSSFPPSPNFSAPCHIETACICNPRRSFYFGYPCSCDAMRMCAVVVVVLPYRVG